MASSSEDSEQSSDGTSSLPSVPSQARVPSGVQGLDVILGGGFIRSGIYIIMGAPGSGKTILANQTCYNHIASGGKALYITLLSETHSRMLANLRSLSFFDPTHLTTSMNYVSGYSALQRDGLNGLTELIRKEIRQRRATILVLDGLTTAEAVAQTALDFKNFIDQLHVYTELNGCTTLLLSHPYESKIITYKPEYTMVDGLIELRDSQVDERAVREMLVLKFRGSSYLRGQHLFQITGDGIVVYPRLEARLKTPAVLPEFRDQRLLFGIEGLDKMLGPQQAGLLAGSISMLLGAPGTGKTLLGLNFLNQGLAQGEPCLLFGFHESPSYLMAAARHIGLTDFERYVKQSSLEILWQPPLEDIADVLAERLLQAVQRTGAKRVFIDSFQGFSETIYPLRLTRFFTALNNELRSRGVTTLLAVEPKELFSPSVVVPNVPVSPIFDNVMFLRYMELQSQLYRLVSIIKERNSSFDMSIRELIISSDGIKIGGQFSNVQAIITGIAQPLSGREQE